jgi:hypothetical protein
VLIAAMHRFNNRSVRFDQNWQLVRTHLPTRFGLPGRLEKSKRTRGYQRVINPSKTASIKIPRAILEIMGKHKELF